MTQSSAENSVAELAELFRLPGETTRLRIVPACLDTPIAVNIIASKPDLSSSLVSHQLRLLRTARIVKADRHGKQVFCAAAGQHITGALADMPEHIAESHMEAD
jgi:DNA-binding transcriptional ArsR family regulator